MLHDMLQFTNIAWPVLPNELVHFMPWNIGQSAVLSLASLAKKLTCRYRNVFTPLPQRWNL